VGIVEMRFLQARSSFYHQAAVGELKSYIMTVHYSDYTPKLKLA